MRLPKFDSEVGILHDLYQNSNLKYGTFFYKVLILSYEIPKELKFVGGMDIVTVNTVPSRKPDPLCRFGVIRIGRPNRTIFNEPLTIHKLLFARETLYTTDIMFEN